MELEKKEERLSNLYTTLSIERAALEKAMNRFIENEPLYEKGKVDDNLHIVASKDGDISIEAEGKKIRIMLPLSLDLYKDLTITTAEAKCKILVIFETIIKISEPWELETKTLLEKYHWIEKPQLKVGLFNLPIESIVDLTLENNQERICNIIDENIEKQLDLKQYVQQGETILQQSIQLSEDWPFFLKIIPSTLGLSPFIKEEGKISMAFKLKALFEFAIGNKFVHEEKVTLPTPIFIEKTKQISNIHLPVFLHYKAIEALAKKQLEGQSFNYEQYHAKFSNIKITKHANGLKVTGDVKGSFNGRAIVWGIPNYDAVNKIISFRDFDLKLETNNIFHKGLAFVLNGIMEKKIQEVLRFPLSNLFTTDLLKQIAETEIQSGIIHRGTVGEYDIEEMKVMDDFAYLEIAVKGSSHFFIDPSKIDLDDLPSKPRSIEV